MDWFKNCTKKCNTAPHVCDCDFMTGRAVFLTDDQRERHDRAYRRGETLWSSPFEPWVVETWQRGLQADGWDKAAQRFREGRAKMLQELHKLKK